jgi:hypothetical protein
MIKEGYYKCTSSNYVVITEMHGRIPVQKSYVLRKDELYRVNSVGKLEIPGMGTARITDSVENILVPYESEDEIKHWDEIRTQASIHIMASVIGMQKLGVTINLDRVANVAVTAADALVRKLKDYK